MAKGPTRKTTAVRAPELYEVFETAVIQSTDVNELKNAYRMYASLTPQDRIALLAYAGPARSVSLALRGYELPSFQARLTSSEFLLSLLNDLSERSVPRSLREQIWLVLAQQRTVLLGTLEEDLEALQYSALEPKATEAWHQTLTRLYHRIRTRSQRAIRHLFTTPLVQPELPLRAAL